MAKAKAGKKTRGSKEKAIKITQGTTRVETAKEITGNITQEANQFETIDQTVQRVKKDMAWVGVSIVVSAIISLVVGQLIKF